MLRCMSADGGSAIRVIDESGLTFTQMKVLMTLAGAREQAPSLKPVAEGLGLSLPSASRAVDGLVKRALVARTEDPDRSPPAAAGADRRRPGARRPDHGRAAGGARAIRRLARRRASAAPRPRRWSCCSSARRSRTSTASTEGRPTDDPIPPPDHRPELQVVDARSDVLRAVHDHARQHGRQRRPAVDPGRPRLEPLEPRVDDQRLHAQLRRPAGHRRAPRRHLRAPPRVPRRRDHLRPLLGHRRAGHGHRDARREPRRPGGRRRR